jgi:AAHS family 4-hydroxybenzoate transporter-like MFS transporter
MTATQSIEPTRSGNSLYPWQIVGGLSASVVVLMGICLYSFIFLAAAQANEQNWSATQSGGLVSAMWLVAPLALVIAPVINRYGPWPFVVFGVVAQAVSLIGMTYSTQFAELYVLRMVMGVGKVVLMVSAPVIIAGYFTDKFGTALSVFWAFASGAGIVMAALTEHLIGMFGWRCASVTLEVIALCSLPLTAALYFTGRNRYIITRPAAAPIQAAEAAEPDKGSWKDVAGSLGLVQLIFIGLAVFGTGVTAVAMFSHITTLMTQSGFDSEFQSYLVSILSITAVVGALVIGWAMDRFPPVWSALAISAMIASGLATYALMLQNPTATLAIIGTAFLGLGLAAGELMWINLVRRAVVPAQFSTAYGGWYFAIQVGYASGGALAGVFIDQFQGAGLLVTMLALYLPAMVMSVKLARGENKGEQRPA